MPGLPRRLSSSGTDPRPGMTLAEKRALAAIREGISHGATWHGIKNGTAYIDRPNHTRDVLQIHTGRHGMGVCTTVTTRKATLNGLFNKGYIDALGKPASEGE